MQKTKWSRLHVSIIAAESVPKATQAFNFAETIHHRTLLLDKQFATALFSNRFVSKTKIFIGQYFIEDNSLCKGFRSVYTSLKVHPSQQM